MQSYVFVQGGLVRKDIFEGVELLLNTILMYGLQILIFFPDIPFMHGSQTMKDFFLLSLIFLSQLMESNVMLAEKLS